MSYQYICLSLLTQEIKFDFKSSMQPFACQVSERLREILEVKLEFPHIHEETNLLLSQKELFRLTTTKIHANYYTKLSLDQLLCDENFSTVTIVFEDSSFLSTKRMMTVSR